MSAGLADIPEIFGRDVLALKTSRRSSLVERARAYWRRRGFPYPRISSAETALEIARLQRAVASWSRGGTTLQTLSTVGLRLANAFHPQIWRIKKKGRSPLECFQDDERLRIALEKAPKFWPDRRCWNGQCVRSVMRIYHKTKVSNFRPVVARAIVARYSSERDTVVDFSAGYGGRLLGTMVLDRHYVGIDAARAQIKGLQRTARSLAGLVPGTADLHHGCAEDLLPLLPLESVQLVFTSPPFFALERYSTEPTQSYIRYPNYDSWRENFLYRVMRQAHRILKRNGWLVLNLADGLQYRLLTDASKLGRDLFRYVQVLRFPIYCIPSSRDVAHCRWDYLLALRKA